MLRHMSVSTLSNLSLVIKESRLLGQCIDNIETIVEETKEQVKGEDSKTEMESPHDMSTDSSASKSLHFSERLFTKSEESDLRLCTKGRSLSQPVFSDSKNESVESYPESPQLLRSNSDWSNATEEDQSYEQLVDDIVQDAFSSYDLDANGALTYRYCLFFLFFLYLESMLYLLLFESDKSTSLSF